MGTTFAQDIDRLRQRYLQVERERDVAADRIRELELQASDQRARMSEFEAEIDLVREAHDATTVECCRLEARAAALQHILTHEFHVSARDLERMLQERRKGEGEDSYGWVPDTGD